MAKFYGVAPYVEGSLSKPKQMEIFGDREWMDEKQKEMKDERDGRAQWMQSRGKAFNRAEAT